MTERLFVDRLAEVIRRADGNHDKIQEAWEEYVSQPSNFGADSPLVRFAERDAFFAGAVALLKQSIPF